MSHQDGLGSLSVVAARMRNEKYSPWGRLPGHPLGGPPATSWMYDGYGQYSLEVGGNALVPVVVNPVS